MKSPTWLLEHQRNVYSQMGEDGIIETILELLPNRNNWCVEFGAWDGEYLSNTCNLIENHEFNAVLIEGSAAKFPELKKRFACRDGVIPINGFVGFGAGDGLDSFLCKTPIPEDFDFLSIDIDGNDFHVWKAVSAYRPKIVCIEFNPTIPSEVDYVQPADPTVQKGCSPRSLVALGKEKGYELVCVQRFNCIFVAAEYFPLFEIGDNSLQTLRTDLSGVTWIFNGYDGEVMLAGADCLSWHGLVLPGKRFQCLPSFLRRYSNDYSPFQRLLFKYWRKWWRLRYGKPAS